MLGMPEVTAGSTDQIKPQAMDTYACSSVCELM